MDEVLFVSIIIDYEKFLVEFADIAYELEWGDEYQNRIGNLMFRFLEIRNRAEEIINER